VVGFGQWLIEFLKTIGLGALFGAAVGAGITGRQKANEALRAIKAVNYREVVRAYTELIIHLERTQSAALRMVSKAGALLHIRELEDDGHTLAGLSEEIKQELETTYSEYRTYRDGLPEKLAPIETHQSQSSFFRAVTLCKMAADMLDHSLSMLTYKVTAESVDEADSRHNELRTDLRNLNNRWAIWKEKEEMAASGLPSAPLRQRAIKALRGMILFRSRRNAQLTPVRDEKPTPSPTGDVNTPTGEASPAPEP
jgi:hypothetical protein